MTFNDGHILMMVISYVKVRKKSYLSHKDSSSLMSIVAIA